MQPPAIAPRKFEASKAKLRCNIALRPALEEVLWLVRQIVAAEEAQDCSALSPGSARP